jgi:hypothetical protein
MSINLIVNICCISFFKLKPPSNQQVIYLARKNNSQMVTINLDHTEGVVLKQKKMAEENGRYRFKIEVHKAKNIPVEFLPFRFQRTSVESKTFHLHLDTKKLQETEYGELLLQTDFDCVGA